MQQLGTMFPAVTEAERAILKLAATELYRLDRLAIAEGELWATTADVGGGAAAALTVTEAALAELATAGAAPGAGRTVAEVRQSRARSDGLLSRANAMLAADKIANGATNRLLRLLGQLERFMWMRKGKDLPAPKVTVGQSDNGERTPDTISGRETWEIRKEVQAAQA